jgi:hypothetical protein
MATEIGSLRGELERVAEDRDKAMREVLLLK